ncbi:MAG: endonuclease/exonuclease/phosphatase family protein [Alphaproteobacteria bacterium]|nr:endonuclease/exonuclease/phosphatase family protein [Alphaproteobacteria bacterium]MBM3640603.1 endonuclease/exonuclease/phosphatase family protein [Alphaproteobacteria bacterium]
MPAFRLATFNLENLDWSATKPNDFARRADALRPLIETLDADILCLQEIHAQRLHKHGARQYIALDQLLATTRYAQFHRATTVRPGGEVPADVHNLAILSRWPMRARRQIHHDIVAQWAWPPPRDADGSQPEPVGIVWDRPLLYAAIELPQGGVIHVVNLHLRAPRAFPVATARGLGSSRAQIEGQFVAALKREGQALEARLFAETLFDADPQALIAIAGDFNADEHDAPTRLLRGGGDEGATGARVLIPLEERVEPGRRFTVIHAGRPMLIDHLLASPALAAAWRKTTILNEGLQDEVYAEEFVEGSLHAPVVARFELVTS